MVQEIRLVSEKETFKTQALRELAKTRSACLCKIQFGRCKLNECSGCHVSEQFEHCYNALNDYDKLRFANYVSKQYVEDSRTPQDWMTHKQLKKSLLKPFKISLIVFLVVFLLSSFGLNLFCNFMNNESYWLLDIDMIIDAIGYGLLASSFIWGPTLIVYILHPDVAQGLRNTKFFEKLNNIESLTEEERKLIEG